jgi:hypothetical protein
MRPPIKIFQCRNGHVMCESCKNHPEVVTCPTCRIPLPGRQSLSMRLINLLFQSFISCVLKSLCQIRWFFTAWPVLPCIKIAVGYRGVCRNLVSFCLINNGNLNLSRLLTYNFCFEGTFTVMMLLLKNKTWTSIRAKVIHKNGFKNIH